MRECTGCRETKPLDAFGPQARGPGGLNRRCRECVSSYLRKYRQRQRLGAPETAFSQARSDREAGNLTRLCALCMRELPLEDFRQRPNRNDFTLRCVSCRTGPRTPRDSWLWTTYRIREDDYLSMRSKQGGVCAICHREPKGPLVVDHDHGCCPGRRTCGRCIRGLLCDNCNRSLSVVDSYRDQVMSYLKIRMEG